MNTTATTIPAPRATAPPRPVDPAKRIAESVTYLRIEQQCGATHIRIEEVLALLGAAPGPGEQT